MCGSDETVAIMHSATRPTQLAARIPAAESARTVQGCARGRHVAAQRYERTSPTSVYVTASLDGADPCVGRPGIASQRRSESFRRRVPHRERGNVAYPRHEAVPSSFNPIAAAVT